MTRKLPFGSVGAALALFMGAGAALAQPHVIDTVAGNGSYGYAGMGGPAINAAVGNPTAVLAMPGSDAYYIGSGTVLLRVNDAGNVQIVGGSGTEAGSTGGFSGDGGPAVDALFSEITSIAYNHWNNSIYVVDHENARVRRIDAQGVVTTVAGNGNHQFSADPGPAVERPLRWPRAIAFDYSGTLYIADHSSIRKVGNDGVMHLVAGGATVGFAGDGLPAANARFNQPNGLVAAPDGNLYIADRGNGRLRRLGSDGMVTTIGAFSPSGLATDRDGNLYFARSDSARVERYMPHNASVQPVAGVGTPGFSGDGGAAVDAQLGDGVRLSVDEYGEVYLADFENRRVRRVSSMDANLPRANFYGEFVQEGDEGITRVTLRLRLESPAIEPVDLEVTTMDGTATSDHDYIAMQSVPFQIPTGATEGSFDVEVVGDRFVEGYESFTVFVQLIRGAAMSTGGYLGADLVSIIDDDEATPEEFFLRDDLAIVPENATSHSLLVTFNDSGDYAHDGSGLSIVSPPAAGEVRIAYPYVFYTPPRDWTGEERFTYQLCDTGGRCLTAQARLLVRPLDDEYLLVASHSGRAPIPVRDWRDMPGARYVATPLVAPAQLDLDLGVDTTPASPWDSDQGVAWRTRTVAPPANGQARRLRVVAMDATAYGFSATLRMGLDRNGDGRPSEDELECIQEEFTRRCELEIQQLAGQSVRYWVMLQSRNAEPSRVQVDVFEVPMVSGDGSLAATGPARLPASHDFDLNLTWNDPTFIVGQTRVGFVQVFADAGVATGEFLVILASGGSDEQPIRLVTGSPRRLALAPGSENTRIYFDVPVGTRRIAVSSQSAANIDLHLVAREYPTGAGTEVLPLAEPYTPVASGTGPTGNETVVVTSGLLQPARWYVVAVNRDGSPAEATLRVDIEADAPDVRAGSYFNAARSGHGLFLYPAGGDWAGLWYTYRENGSPTWYYLQAAAPGASGIWTAPIFRAAWNGSANHLTEVGSATLTPSGPDAFQFSFKIDGLEGSEPMAALGRGCPSANGNALDLSSHWFDPAHAGTGYSVQMLPNYEFIAAFVYDSLGEPRFLVAERPGFGGGDELLDVEQLGGVCPTCTYYGRPSRATVGTLRRVLGNGTLQALELDAIFTRGPMNIPVPGAWSSVDMVVPLGGPGTTQGCAP